MTGVAIGGSPSAFRQGAEHTLFVEGRTPETLDPTVLQELVRPLDIEVRPLGSSRHVKSVAEALYAHHPKYYFVVDRDHHSESEVEATWSDFPDPAKQNLLVWRKRELENYFIDPTYASRSSFVRNDRAVQDVVLELASARVYLDIANQVVVSIREELKTNWITIAESTDGYRSLSEALDTLKGRPEFASYMERARALAGPSAIDERFQTIAEEFLAGEPTPVIG
jgi:hypothetical protein